MLLAAWYHPILAVLFAFLAVLLILIILLQRGRGAGLSGAFGGAGGAATATFGSKTGDMLTWITVVLAGILLLYAIVLNFVFRSSDDLPLNTTAVTAPTGGGAGAGAGATDGATGDSATDGSATEQGGEEDAPAESRLPRDLRGVPGLNQPDPVDSRWDAVLFAYAIDSSARGSSS